LDLDDSDSVRTVQKLLRANESWARVFFDSAERGASSKLVGFITNDDHWTKDLSQEDVDDFDATVAEMSLNLRKSVAQAKSPDDILKANATAINTYLVERDKLRDKRIIAEALDKESKRLETAARKAAGLTDKASNRDGKSPPAKPSGAAGTGERKSVEQELVDPNTPIARLAELRGRKV